jgi:membrane associated rhomboid family serine protease
MHQASVGFHCPDCTKAGAQKVYRGPAALRVRPVVTQVLVGLNVAIYLLGMLADRRARLSGVGGSFAVDFGLIAKFFVDVPTGIVQLSGGVGDGEPYRIITSGFLHAGVLHLAMNMWALWILGQMVENVGGRVRFALVYGVALVGGSFGALLLSPGSLTVGASGAIFGLMGAILAVGKARGIPLRQSPMFGILILNLVITFGIPGISIGGHLGGLLAGGVAGWLLYDVGERPSIGGSKATAMASALGVVLFVAGVVVASGYQP